MALKHGLVVFFLLLAPLELAAQSNPPRRPPAGSTQPSTRTARLVVRIRANDGTPLTSQALVRLVSPMGGFNESTSLSAGGEAVFPFVPSGDYQLEIRAPGFREHREMVTVLEIGSTTYANVELQPEAATPGSGTNGAVAVPLLAPKARQELEAGLAALREERLADAHQRLMAAYGLAPGHPDVNYLLGMYYLKLGDAKQARGYLDKAIALYPKHGAALGVLGRVLHNDGDYAAAVPILERAIVANPASWETHWTLASALFNQGQYERARAHAEKALEGGSTRAPQIRVLLARALAALGQRERGMEQVELFLQQYPQHPAAVTARRLLAELRSRAAAQPSP